MQITAKKVTRKKSVNFKIKQSTTDYENELNQALLDHNLHKATMEEMRNYYQFSAFYPRKSGEKTQQSLKSNLLRVFADKNIHYSSPLPTFKVATTGADEVQREAASIREKIIYGTHAKNNTELLQKLWSFDATLMSTAVAETTFDLDKRCVKIRRYDPRYCFWQFSNDSEMRVVAFWCVYPITLDEAHNKYGVTPTSSGVDVTGLKAKSLARVDGKEWFLFATRVDENNRASWIGDKWVEEPHNHQMGFIPIDVAIPFYDGNLDQRGSFFLEPLLPLQAEYNEVLRTRSAIVKRVGNPVIWGRGIVNRQFEDTKRALSKPGGGFVGLKQQGELGILQVTETNMIKEYLQDLKQEMMQAAGFGAASFGEIAGANTSGDALGMYFNPTQMNIDNQNIAWKAFYKSINSKILRLYDQFLKPKEQVSLAGFVSHGTLVGMSEDKSKREYKQGGFSVTFGKEAINGEYDNIVIPKSVTPKDELATKRLLMEAVKQGVISRTTAFEDWGIISPQDELQLLEYEQQNPAFNPQGLSSLMTAAKGMEEAPQDVQPPQTVSE